jgi:hypothetical protein
MGRHIWGRTAAGVLLAAAVMSTSACGADSEADAKPQAKQSKSSVTPAQKLRKAAEKYTDDLDELEMAGCPTDCGPDMADVYDNALGVRNAMQDSDARTGTFTVPLQLINTLEKGFIVYGQSGDSESSRPSVLGPAYKLRQWLDDNPV